MRLDCSDIAGGIILADGDLTPQSDWFEPDYWLRRDAGEPIGEGRGRAVGAGEKGQWVLRHYHRGGLPGRFLDDGYLWRGAEATRPVRELRLLAALCERGAPVARPVAARVLRAGLVYRGDILTERVMEARTLGERAVRLDPETWARVGETIRRFHAAGGWHADLNAHNILIAPAGVFVIDLDRGRLVAPGARGQRSNLDRLHRSLLKLGRLPGVEAGWQALLDAYRRSS
ncbi:MAG: 3-deoxy-D-manno-octulosonic acid kinase [Gammaproteobacteria bacterium]|nr:3-deoxy-D-manno-octulosonic acid kinase [Gammaproteobacteria bacterium]